MTCRFCHHDTAHRSYGCADASCPCMAPPQRAYAPQPRPKLVLVSDDREKAAA